MDTTSLQALITSLNIGYSAVFVPFSKSRNKDEKHLSLNWQITITKGGRTLVTDYMQGIGHLPGYSHQSANKLKESRSIQYAAESGKWESKGDKAGFRVSNFNFSSWPAIPAPSFLDVLYTLVQDSKAVLYGSFEEWADEMGFDADSIKDSETYKGCLNQGLMLQSMITPEKLNELREAYQDY